jgi:hypothetical protein
MKSKIKKAMAKQKVRETVVKKQTQTAILEIDMEAEVDLSYYKTLAYEDALEHDMGGISPYITHWR